MGLTIEDVMIQYSDRYKITLLAGRNGWANSISWIHLMEDTTIIKNFWGKELAVTTGLGFPQKGDLLFLVRQLLEYHCAGLIVNVGNYITEIPEEVVCFCNENDFPLLTVPWEIWLAEMIKDLTIRIFLQGSTDKEISDALIAAIEEPRNREHYCKHLMSSFDLDGSFQVIVISMDGLDSLDSIDRQKISYRLQVYLENITHNASFFYYASCFVLVANAISAEYLQNVAEGMMQRATKRMPERHVYVGIGSRLFDIGQLHISYSRAMAAVEIAKNTRQFMVNFDDCGIYRLLYSISDHALLHEIEDDLLSVIEEYDKKHNSNYLETLEMYLKYDGSIQAVSEVLYTHRNTVIYRINSIKKMLGTDLKSSEERLRYQLAFYIRKMKL